MTATPADSRQHLAARDAALLQLFTGALDLGDRQALEFAAVQHVLRDAMEGQPRVQSYDGIGRSSDTPDPTGTAAQRIDRASGIASEIRDRIGRVVRELHEIDRLYDVVRPDLAPGPPAGVKPERDPNWCRICWDAGVRSFEHMEIKRKADGSKRLGDRCAAHCTFYEREGFDPTPDFTRKLKRGERITPGMLNLERDLHRSKGRKRRGKRSKAAA